LLRHDLLRAVINVATGQIGNRRVTVLEVCADGVNGKVEPDQVAEAYAMYQVRVKQPRIGAEYIVSVCTLNVSARDDSRACLYAGSNARLRSVKGKAIAQMPSAAKDATLKASVHERPGMSPPTDSKNGTERGQNIFLGNS
jgi:hypothetical protein